MVDRLAELQKNSNVVPAASEADEEASTASEEAFMKEFFVEVGSIRSQMALIRSNITKIGEQHGASLAATSAEQGATCSKELEILMDETNQSTSSVRQALKRMEESNQTFAAESTKGSAEDRIRTSTHGSLTRTFVELMTEYQELQTRFKTKYKERVERQFRIVKPEATAEEIEEVVEGNGNHDVFSQQILSPGHRAVKNALADIQDRHKDIIKLEQSIAELHQLFLDMAVLVEAQGELLDQIEYSVSQSVNYTEKGVDQLRKANKYQKKSRQKMCCLGIILIAGLMILIGPILASTLGSA